MDRLYIMPVGEDWIAEFRDTVTEPVPVPVDAPADLKRQDEARIWGTTTGDRKQTYFESMEPGDPVLFYNEGKFFASGRVGTTFESPEAGFELWSNEASRFVFTLKDYEEISVGRERFADLLGYDSDWAPQGFMKASADAVGTLLQEYNSIEEAFQDFQADESDSSIIEPSEEDEDEPREHTRVQYYLIQLGLQHGYDVYVAKNDKNRTYEGERLGEDCVETLNLPGFSSAATRIIEYIDVIWLEDNFIVKMFEVESTTSIYSGILRMTDFMVKVPNVAVDMHIVAASDDEDKVREEINRPTFQQVLGDAEHCSLRFLSFADVRNTYETVRDAGPLQEAF